VTTSKQISIPQGLLDFAEISAKVVVVGQGAFLELWSEDNWKKQAIVLDSGEISFNDTISLTLER
jgi:DNA-binding transcriptional regulator/RsmH inhibitor MraZ